MLAPSPTRCRFVEAQEASGKVRRSECPNGAPIPARGETPGMPHNRSVLKERRIHPGALTCFAVAECRGWRWGSLPRRGAPRDRPYTRRERGDRLGVRAAARGGSGCRRSYARSGPVPLPLATSSGMRSSPFLGNESTAGGTALERRYFDGRAPAASRDRRTAHRASRRGVGILARRASRWGS